MNVFPWLQRKVCAFRIIFMKVMTEEVYLPDQPFNKPRGQHLKAEKTVEKRRRFVREILEILTLTLLMFLILRFAVQNFRIDGPSMEPSLHNEEYILVDKAAYLFHEPERGDVIVFEYPLDPQLDYVKRVIAIPGDIISVVGTQVTVDGITLNEPYVNKNDPGNPFPPINNRIVGPNEYFVMGDNRGDSSDSRQWGFVPRQNIIGKAAFIYWPFGENNFGLLPNISPVFAQVHQ
jgi:signal peptidase I